MVEYVKVGEFKYPSAAMGMGAELKNTVSLGFRGGLYMSPCAGDLGDPANADAHDGAVRGLLELAGGGLSAVGVDLHPDMYSTVGGRALAAGKGVPVFEVQHHHAHAVSCMFEHGLDECLALVFDGTGLGPDGAVWGAELLWSDAVSYKRLASFAAVPLPGGDAAVREPARQLVARWRSAGVEIEDAWLDRLGVSPEACRIWLEQCGKSVNAPISHAAGRLFDSYAMLLGLSPRTIEFEAQPAVNLEAEAAKYSAGPGCAAVPYSCVERDGMFFIDWSPAFREINLADARHRTAEFAYSFHLSVVEASVRMIEFGLSRCAARGVVLSGGCFVNRFLKTLLPSRLGERGLNVFMNMVLSCGDAGVSAGQALSSAARLVSDR